MAKKEAKKPIKRVKKTKKVVKKVITDISREYFNENGVEMVRISELNGKKTVSSIEIPSIDDNAQ